MKSTGAYIAIHIISMTDSSLRRSNSPTFLALPQFLRRHPALDDRLQLRPEVSDMKSLPVNDSWFGMRRVTTVPLQRVYVQKP
jgi:hypothetical protein